MPWPQLPSGEDILNDIFMFFKVCVIIAVLFILGTIGKVVWFDKSELGKTLIEKQKQEQIEEQKKDIERKKREIERLQKEIGQ